MAVNSAGTRYSAPANLYVRGKPPVDPGQPLTAVIQVSACRRKVVSPPLHQMLMGKWALWIELQ